jgi:hypothetical protein
MKMAKLKFRTVLLQRAQHYFEKTDKETQDADLEDKEISASEAEEKRVKAKRHYLGNIRSVSEFVVFPCTFQVCNVAV